MTKSEKEKLLVRLAPVNDSSDLSKEAVRELLGAEIDIDNPDTRNLLTDLATDQIIRLSDDGPAFLTIMDPRKKGVPNV